jgi:hypothetical protein
MMQGVGHPAVAYRGEQRVPGGVARVRHALGRGEQFGGGKAFVERPRLDFGSRAPHQDRAELAGHRGQLAHQIPGDLPRAGRRRAARALADHELLDRQDDAGRFRGPLVHQPGQD